MPVQNHAQTNKIGICTYRMYANCLTLSTKLHSIKLHSAKLCYFCNRPTFLFAKISSLTVVVVWCHRELHSALGILQVGKVTPSVDFDLHLCKSCIVWIMVRKKHLLSHSKLRRKYWKTKVLIMQKHIQIKDKYLGLNILIYFYVLSVVRSFWLTKLIEFNNLISTNSQNPFFLPNISFLVLVTFITDLHLGNLIIPFSSHLAYYVLSFLYALFLTFWNLHLTG